MAVVAVDRAVSPAHGSMVDQAEGVSPCLDLTLWIKDPMVLDVCKREVVAGSPECGGSRRRACRRGPRSCYREPNRPRAGFMCSWSICARNRAKKTAVPAIMMAYTERGRCGFRQHAGAGATLHAQDKKWRRSDAHHTEMERTCLLARKK
jgi:hypothetical protein